VIVAIDCYFLNWHNCLFCLEVIFTSRFGTFASSCGNFISSLDQAQLPSVIATELPNSSGTFVIFPRGILDIFSGTLAIDQVSLEFEQYLHRLSFKASYVFGVAQITVLFSVAVYFYQRLSSLLFRSFLSICQKMGQRKATSREEQKRMEKEKEAEHQAWQECERRQAAALAKLKADKDEQERKKLATLPSSTNKDNGSCVCDAIGNDEIIVEKTIVMKDSDKKKSASDPQGQRLVGAVLPDALDEGVHESLPFSARMKMKLPLQRTNVVVQKKSTSSNDTSLQNDAACVEGIIQSVTELSVSKDSDKKTAAVVLPNSITDHEEVANVTTDVMPISASQQTQSVSKDCDKNAAAEVLSNGDKEEFAKDNVEANIDSAPGTMSNSIAEQEVIIHDIRPTNIDVSGDTTDNNVPTTDVLNNDDRASLDRFQSCLETYKSICAAQQAIEAQLINSCDDYKVNNNNKKMEQ